MRTTIDFKGGEVVFDNTFTADDGLIVLALYPKHLQLEVCKHSSNYSISIKKGIYNVYLIRVTKRDKLTPEIIYAINLIKYWIRK